MAATLAHLQTLQYSVDSRVLRLNALGIAQQRKRHVIVAVAAGGGRSSSVLDELESRQADPQVSLAWAIADLVEMKPSDNYDTPSSPSAENLARMRWLLEHDQYDLPNRLRPRCHQDNHSYKSMYGRLRWELPAQTITSGFGSIGQGRYMHPTQARALTPHEAARLQGFPDYFSFDGVATRSALATMIGNAVPPQLARAITLGLFAGRGEPPDGLRASGESE